jgi:uncharacterized protein YuzE
VRLEIDPEADAAYVRMRETGVARTTPLDSQRIVDYDADGEVVGIEFLAIHQGLDLRDLPYHDQLTQLFEGLGRIPISA